MERDRDPHGIGHEQDQFTARAKIKQRVRRVVDPVMSAVGSASGASDEAESLGHRTTEEELASVVTCERPFPTGEASGEIST